MYRQRIFLCYQWIILSTLRVGILPLESTRNDTKKDTLNKGLDEKWISYGLSLKSLTVITKFAQCT